MSETMKFDRLSVAKQKSIVGAILKAYGDKLEIPEGLHRLRFDLGGSAIIRSTGEFTETKTCSIPWTVVVCMFLERVPAARNEMLDCIKRAVAMTQAERKATKGMQEWESLVDEMAGVTEATKRTHTVLDVSEHFGRGISDEPIEAVTKENVIGAHGMPDVRKAGKGVAS